METERLLEHARELPSEPGVYQFHSDDRVIYVGKAVDLRDRVRSYTDPRSDRIARMLREASQVEVAVTDTETQAVLLEANLIKRYQPRYNVRLTDDKSYPLIQLTSHEVPRIQITRDPDDDARVFGPFTSMSRVEMVVKALREIYGVRGCSDHKYANRDRPCQDFEIGLCTAPCTNEISVDEYIEDVDSVVQYLKGASGVLTDPLSQKMEDAADDRNFERAAHLRDRLKAARALHGGSGEAVYSREDETTRMDVLGVAVRGTEATVAVLQAEAGKLVDRSRQNLDVPAGESTADVVAAFIPQYYSDRALPDRLVLSDHPEDAEVIEWLSEEGIEMSVPGTGRERKLVDLALQNARRRIGGTDATKRLAHELELEETTRIEGFDVSHSHGTSVVGSNVTFFDGDPEKSGYRRKKLDDENDDYANMYRLVHWRASRAIEGRDDRRDPDLLLIDGGQGQLSAAERALEEVGWDIPVIALAKDEEVVYANGEVYYWDESAPELHLLQRIRDEAHRFAVQYHQTVRDEISTILDDIPGIGTTRSQRLLHRFGSIDGIRNASLEELQSVDGIGKETAKAIDTNL